MSKAIDLHSSRKVIVAEDELKNSTKTKIKTTNMKSLKIVVGVRSEHEGQL